MATVVIAVTSRPVQIAIGGVGLASVQAAANDAAAARADRLQADADALSCAASVAQIAEVLTLSGVSAFFATKAAANAATLSAGAIIMVFADEGAGGDMTIYREQAGALALQVDLTAQALAPLYTPAGLTRLFNAMRAVPGLLASLSGLEAG